MADMIRQITSPTLHFLIALNLLRIPYPEVRRDVAAVDDYFGTKVADPYRSLEDLNSEETKNFVHSQQRLTDEFLNSIPTRTGIQETIKSVWNFSRYSVPMKVQNRYFYMHNSGLQNHSVLYVQEGLEGTPAVYFDPSHLSPDGSVTLDHFSFSGDGQYFAYFVQEKGSDWRAMQFKDALTGADLPDVLVNIKSAQLVWSDDSQGVFYVRFPFHDKTNMAQLTLNEKVFYHKVGTEQENDILLAEFPWSPTMRLSMKVTHDGNYLLIIGIESFNATSIYIAPLWDGINANVRSKIVPLFPSPTADTTYEYEYVANEESTFMFRTSKGAPMFKLATVNVDLHAGQFGAQSVNMWSTFVNEHPEKVLEGAVLAARDKVLLRYVYRGEHHLELHSLHDGLHLHSFKLPQGSITGYYSSGNINETTVELFIRIENFLNPGTIYRCLVNTVVQCTIFRQMVVQDVDLNHYISEYVQFSSKDGTDVAMHVIRKKSVPLDGTAPTLLYSYGGFNVDTLPYFSITNLVFMEHLNGIYAQPMIRGGGEFGTQWYNDGALLNRQHSLEDFQAAAEYLVQNNYTSPSKLTMKGSSHGGLVTAACINQRPDLYGAAIVQNGVLDLLRHQHFTVGKMWCTEYGCSDDKIQFESLIKYSPLHNIRIPSQSEVQYPAVLVMTADHDDRVVPSHSYKYTAELQHTVGSSSKQTNPLLLRVGKDVGHSNAKPLYKLVDDITDILAFISEALGLQFGGLAENGGTSPNGSL